VPAVWRTRARPAALLALIACSTLCAAPVAHAARTFKPRIKGALGIVPARGSQEVAISSNLQLVYHGGAVLHHVTVHTVFWAPAGFHFNGSPQLLVPGYQPLIEQFFTDVAHDSGSTSNEFSLGRQYPDSSGPAGYSISYSAGADSIYDTDPYPPATQRCASPSGIAACVTDLQLEQELDHVISSHEPGGRGLQDIWFVYLPPNVDECVAVASCGTNAFGGYHSLANVGHGPIIYAVIPDPLIEFTPPPGSDPQGNPDAEVALDVTGHELAEAITDPEGVGWMDPNGFEVGDKCEVGPQDGTPLGFAFNGSPYNQVINGHEYLLQMLWSNADAGCAQRTNIVTRAPAVARVALTQFSRRVTGTATPNVSVRVLLVRAGILVAAAVTRADGNGRWSVSLAHAPGDDRDLIAIRYGPGGPPPDLIATGNGGDPYSQSGFTGWYDLDSGYAVHARGVLLSPCSQVGVLAINVHGSSTPPPIERCETETDVAPVATAPIGAGAAISMSSQDNRAVSGVNPLGALVKLTIPLGEPGSVPSLGNPQVPFTETGFPTCAANLAAQIITCDGLVPGTTYTVARAPGHSVAHARADGGGEIRVKSLAVHGGNVLALRNSEHRMLTVLHVAHLQVHLVGHKGTIASGRCEPGEWFGPQPPPLPAGLAALLGSSLTGARGQACPLSGRAAGFPASGIEQADDRSGGLTSTAIPPLERLSPADGAELYGRFVVLAELGPHTGAITLAVRVVAAATGRAVFYSPDINATTGDAVATLPAGVYHATWVVRDANGDTRTLRTRFIEAG